MVVRMPNMNQDLVSYSSSLGRPETRVSFIPKYRHEIFAYPRIKAVRQLVFYDTAKQYGFAINGVGFDMDHLHMILSLPPTMSAAKRIQLLKGISSRKLFKAFPCLRKQFFWGGNLWSGAYYFDSIGRTASDVIYNYVRNQRQKGDELRKLTEFTN